MCVIGNKGAVGVSFMFNGTSFGFVNSHLTSGSEKKLRWRIGSTLKWKGASNGNQIYCLLKSAEVQYVQASTLCGAGPETKPHALYFYRRNQNYINILRFLNLGDKKLSPFDITHRFTHVFWFGDLNYRIDLPFMVKIVL